MKKWEYNILGIKKHSTDKLANLDDLGDNGWELVSVLDVSDTVRMYYFKREKTEKANPIDEH